MSALTLKLMSIKPLEDKLLDLKCVRKCKLDGIACPQGAFPQAHMLLLSARLKRLIWLSKQLLACRSKVCPHEFGCIPRPLRINYG
jgi:hypothetical protein